MFVLLFSSLLPLFPSSFLLFSLCPCLHLLVSHSPLNLPLFLAVFFFFSNLSYLFFSSFLTSEASSFPTFIIGSTEALPILCVRCARWERERYRERQTEVTSPAYWRWNWRRLLHFSWPKTLNWRGILHFSLPKNCTLVSALYGPEFRRKWRHRLIRAEIAEDFCTLPCQKRWIGEEFCTFLAKHLHLSFCHLWPWVHTFPLPEMLHSLKQLAFFVKFALSAIVLRLYLCQMAWQGIEAPK